MRSTFIHKKTMDEYKEKSNGKWYFETKTTAQSSGSGLGLTGG